jgi:hypothetical protein
LQRRRSDQWRRAPLRIVDRGNPCWPGARQVPDDMRRAISTTGLAPGMACSGWV